MDKKDILMVVVIAAVVGVVASLITTNVSGDASLSPRDIIAHACNGDKLCEMDNALIAGELEADEAIIGGMGVEDELHIGEELIFHLLDVEGNESFYIQGINGGATFATNTEEGGITEVISLYDRFVDMHNSSLLAGYSTFSRAGSQVHINPMTMTPISASVFEGNGSAYACINNHGGIFRSPTKCNTLE
jgi:hypothetical protein